jgi:hypothetical protein
MHITKTHAGWTFCKGCNEPISPLQSDADNGWCEDCVLRCYDCLDEEQYGPHKPLDFSSVITEPEDTDPESEDPGPPPKSDWLSPILYKGTSDRENRLLTWIRKLFS